MPDTRIYVLLLGLAFAGAFVWYTRRKRALTLDGALSAAAVGLWVLWFAGPLWLLPLFFFFITGTLLGRLSKGRPSAADAKHGKPRDYRQVLCNGGIFAALATAAAGAYREQALLFMCVSMAVSTSDTWSSEIGQYFRQKTWDILRWRPVPVGLSGGVSLAGTLGGLAGAAALAVFGSLLIAGHLDAFLLFRITSAGFSGMLLDSLFGAGLQARYRDPETGSLSDQQSTGNALFSGYRWLGNDAVNLWSNAVVTGVVVVLGH